MWTEMQLHEELENRRRAREIRQYVIENRRQKRREYYFLADKALETDQARTVEQRQFNVHLNLDKPGGRLGSAHKYFFTAKDLKPQVDALIGLARTTDEEMWEVPAPQIDPKHSTPELMDPALKTDFLKRSDDLGRALAHTIGDAGGGFNSSELFVSSLAMETIAGNGFSFKSERSKIYTEVCFSARAEKKTEEMLLTAWAGHPDHIHFSEMCARSRSEAEAALVTELPESGSYPVIVAADVLCEVFHDVLWQINGHQRYLRMPHLEAGRELVKDFAGEPFKIFLDPTVGFGLASEAYSELGFPQKRQLLVQDNRVVSNIYDARIAQYLKQEQTTSLGNLVIESQGSPLDELRRAEPKVLEVLQFSGVFTDPLTLTFSSEIRLGRLVNVRTGESKWIKGGNLSGNLRENLRRVRWSKERTLFARATDPNHPQGYYGPAYALLTDVSVSA